MAALTVALLASPAPDARADSAPAADDWVETTLASMTLEEKVGQLFVTYVYGTRRRHPEPADVAANQAMYGVDNAERADRPDTSLGGIIYFAWTNNVQNPPQIAGLSNGIQDAALAQPQAVPLLIGTDQERGVVARIGPPATQLPGNMALGAGAQQRATPGRRGRSAATSSGDGHQLELRPRGRRQHQPANPVIGVRSFGDRTRAWSPRMTAAQIARLQEARDRRRRQALPRPRRHRDRQPQRAAGHQPHPRGVGAARRAAVPGRDRRRHADRS